MKKNRVGKNHITFELWGTMVFGLLALAALCTCVLAQENTAENWYKSGQELERTGAWQAAIDAYDQAIKLNPEYKEAWCAKCKALSNVNLELSGEGQDTTFDDAVNACNKAIEIDPKNARSWSGKGFVLSQEAMLTANKSEYNDSLIAYEKAIEVAGADKSALAEAWQGKGTVLSQMDRNEEALTAQEKAIELNGSDVYAWMGKAMALSKLGRNEESVQSFDKIIELYPSEDQRIFDYPYIWYSKGRVLEKLGRDEEAAHAYNKSVEDVDTIIGWVASGRDFYMNLSEAWQYKGQLLEEQGRYEESVQALKNATRINPDGLRDWHELGTVLARDLGRYNQSLEAYDRALQLDPSDGDILTGKANVLRSLGRYDEALELYEKVLQLDMQSPHSFFYLAKAWLGKGEILRMQGKYNESFLAYDKALELDPRYPEDVWIGRGRLLDSMGRHSEAQEEHDQSFVSYREIVKNNSRRCDIWHGLGNALMGLNRYEEALKAYDNATRLNPNYAEAWFDKGLALLALNRDAEADAAFAIARKVGYSAEPQILRAPPVVTNVTSLGDDEFIELANNENVAQGFRNLRLIADGDENKSIVLPDFTLEPGQKIRIHFGQGESNQTDLYLSSEIDLNDTAGNLNLRDSIRGIEKGYMEYWTPPAQENSAEYWLKKGNEAAGNGSFEESLQDFGKAIQIDAQNAEAWRGKGNAQKVLGQNDEGNQSLEKSLPLYDEIIKANPEDTNARFNKSMVLTVLGRPKEALNVLNNIIELDPKNYGALGRKAEVLSIIGMYNESINTFDKALQMIPASATETLFSFWMSKGWTLLAHSDNDAALTAFEKGITLNPEDGSAWFFKGDALKALGRQSEADEAYAKAKMNGKPSGMEDPSIEELATRLLQATYPGSTELNDVQLLAGKLPENMPVDLPIPDGARIIGSEVQEDKGIYIVLDVPLMPDQALDFYRKALPSQNWTETDIPGMGRGFVQGDASITFCKGMKNPSITATAHPQENGTDLHISISSDPDYSPCSQTSFDDWLKPIPKLAAPEGARQFNEMMTGGGNRAAVSATLKTEMNSSSLADYYADQLIAANWTRTGGEQSGPSSWSAWSIEDENGLVWNGFLIALDLPGSENQRFVLVQANQEDN